MKTILPSINPQKETEKIVLFIQRVLKDQGFKKVVIGVSGGIDSATSFYLLKKSLSSKEIISVYMPYNNTPLNGIEPHLVIPIKNAVDEIKKTLHIPKHDKMRIGNVMARTRMITLFDIAKKENALVCGTENKSEHFLSYFTRFGDEASDFEPIRHLYKTQVYELARFLKVPKEILDANPSAGLWENQTDEGEFGFSYNEADQVLYAHFKLRRTLPELEKEFTNAKKIIDWVLKNDYKHHVPYVIK